MSNFKHPILGLAAGTACLLNAGLAAAQGGRDTGVGRVIAAQGNAALEQIHADLQRRLRQLGPAPLPAAVKTDAPPRERQLARSI